MIDWLKSLLGFQPEFGGVARSSKWPAVMHAFLKGHPTCEVCGSKNKLLAPLNIHHCQPYHLHPELELDPTNLITLCRPHHLLVGHLMNWSSFNKDVREDAKIWLNKVINRPVGNPVDVQKGGVE
jgi:5-methylcytosine-specific restriction endonuclease McrA